MLHKAFCPFVTKFRRIEKTLLFFSNYLNIFRHRKSFVEMKFLKYEEKMKGKSNILARRITTTLAHWLINNNNRKKNIK
jgi:hypothetical protein